MIYFTSDWHAYCSHEVRLQLTPFKSSKEMIAALIKNTNEEVSWDDTLVFVGDLCDYTTTHHTWWREGLAIARLLNCNVELIVGNNEQNVMDYEGITPGLFTEICKSYGISKVSYSGTFEATDGDKVFATHRPTDCRKGTTNVFGHIHLTGPITGIGYNVSCFVNGFRPVSIDKILYARSVVNQYESIEPSAIKLFTEGFNGYWK